MCYSIAFLSSELQSLSKKTFLTFFVPFILATKNRPCRWKKGCILLSPHRPHTIQKTSVSLFSLSHSRVKVDSTSDIGIESSGNGTMPKCGLLLFQQSKREVKNWYWNYILSFYKKLQIGWFYPNCKMMYNMLFFIAFVIVTKSVEA